MDAEMTHNPLSPARDEENRRLANWLEPMPSCEFVVARTVENAAAQFPLKAYRYEFVDRYDSCGHNKYRPAPKDFRTDEAANALLLDKMLGMSEVAVHMMQRNGHFQLALFLPNRPTLSGRDGGSDYVAKDRKAAIVKAALAYLEAQK